MIRTAEPSALAEASTAASTADFNLGKLADEVSRGRKGMNQAKKRLKLQGNRKVRKNRNMKNCMINFCLLVKKLKKS